MGAGAAGLMAAIQCHRRGVPKVLLLDGKKHAGAKILMSGGNRCNVTNFHVTPKDYESENPRFVRDVLRAFPSEKAAAFFQELGVELALEAEGKYFPATHSAKTVLEALLREVRRRGVALQTGCRVAQIRREGNHFALRGEGFVVAARAVILCAGGMSHPATGSDGMGYRLAESFGHTLIPTTPGLTPLLTEDADWKKLSGVSLPCRLTLWVDGKMRTAFEGPFLFTHFGFSGPAVLNISRHWVRQKKEHAVELRADFLPGSNEKKFFDQWTAAAQTHPSRHLKKFLADKLPVRFVEVLLKKIGLSENSILNQILRENRKRLAQSLFHFPLPVTDVFGYQKAEVTAGGVNLVEIDPKTMESRLQAGLFFAGEIVDVDGRIGGFNFQWAWSSGYVAASGAAKRIAALSRINVALK